MSSRMLLAILGLSAKSVVEEEDARELVMREDGAKAVAPAARVARVRAAEKSFMVAVISVYPTVFLVMGLLPARLWYVKPSKQKILDFVFCGCKDFVEDFIPIPTLNSCGSWKPKHKTSALESS